MAEDGSERYALGRLIHDYIRTLMWPAVVLAVVLIYQDDVIEILRNREVKLGGVFELGQQVTQIKQQTGEEIADIRVLLQTLQEADDTAEQAEVAADIETKLANVDRNLTREVEQIQQVAPVQQMPVLRDRPLPVMPSSAPTVSDADRSKAVAYERRGFVALLDRNVDAAREYFAKAAELWPDYHNVAEISRLLERNANALADPRSPEWQRVYRAVLADYSWGIPSELRPALREKAIDAYSISR